MNSVPMLSVVMPVYNERESIEQVVRDWIAELDQLNLDYEFLVLDDGSVDGTDKALTRIAAASSALRVRRHSNRGHGPTILRGYAQTRGEWVLQIDSDGEITPAGFRDLWLPREEFDILIGCRTHRSTTLVRRIVSSVSRLSVQVLFGRGIHDVNVPYRLVRGPLLRQLVASLPVDLFAPNVILSGLAVRHRLRIREVRVQHVGRRHGRSSLGRLNVLRPAAISLWQTWVESRRDHRLTSRDVP